MGVYAGLAVAALAASYGLVHLEIFAPFASTLVRQYAMAWAASYALLAFCTATYRIILWPHFLSPLRKLPGPKGNSLFNGQMKHIFKEESGKPIRDWMNTIPNDGLIRYLGILNKERLVPTTPRTLAEALTSKSYTYIKPPQFIFNLKLLLGNGVLLAEGDEHKRQRKILVPAFHHRHLLSISHVFWEKSQLAAKVLTNMAAEVQGPLVVDIDDWSSRVTLDIIGKAGFAIEFEALTNDDSLLLNTYRKIFKPTRAALLIGLLFNFLPQSLVASLPLQRNTDIANAAATIKKVAQDMIREKRQLFAEKKAGGSQNKDILSVMIEDGQLTDDEMQNQLMTFLAAGHETTSSSVTWCIYALAQDLELQTRLRNDIRAGIPSLDEDNVTSEKLDSIRTLKNVCNETLRFYPPVPVTIRMAKENSSLGGQFVPKGTFVMIPPAAVNRAVSFWGPDADEFKPDRWDKPGNTGGAESNYANLTFLMGPRSCIGQKFAVEEFKYIIAALIGRFQFEIEDPNREVKRTGFVTMRAEGGLNMKVTAIPGW